jgi:exopolysaccharide biosynthesis polyprenyl glycosylphosphotransferase
MRISKTNLLKRLLQTQDVLVGTLVYVLVIDIFWFMGWIPPLSAVPHLQLAPVVLICCVIASVLQAPKLHGQKIVSLVLFAAEYTLTAVTGLLLMIYFGQLDFVARSAVLSYAGLLFLALLADRAGLRWWYFHGQRERPANYLQVIVVGSGDRAKTMMRNYRGQSDWGLHFIGILDPEAERIGRSVDGVPVLGGASSIRGLLATQVVDEVVVCLPRTLMDDIGVIVDACEEEGVCLKFLVDVVDLPEGRLSLETVGDQPLLNLEPVAHDEGKLIVKRIVELFLAIVLVFLLLPVFVLAALAIKLDSPGPVFYVQKRVGLNKRVFSMLKFRSMYVDADERLAEIEHLNEAEGPIFKIAEDPRVTRVGRIIRRTSIDELPQLFNVVLGHMNLIGPRPMSLRDVDRFSRGIQRRRFSVRPGLACLREVSGRSDLSFEEWLRLDLEYIDQWSLWLDLKILLRIVPAVLKGDGAS